MPSFLADDTTRRETARSSPSRDIPSDPPKDKQPISHHQSSLGNGTPANGIDGIKQHNGIDGVGTSSLESHLDSLMSGRRRGRTHGSIDRASTDARRPSASSEQRSSIDHRNQALPPTSSRAQADDDSYFSRLPNGVPIQPSRPRSPGSVTTVNGADTVSMDSRIPDSLPSNAGGFAGSPGENETASLPLPSGSGNRFSSPAILPTSHSTHNLTPIPSSQSHVSPSRLQHRHTLQVPKPLASRSSREYTTSHTNASDDVVSATGRFSPSVHGGRRASMSIGRRRTRSIQSDLHLDEIPQDEDAARWAEAIRQKRASKRKRREEEDDDRVVVGTKVDQNHVNYVTAYNMLTGIRFTVSRTNAKMDRELTEADFHARHKFSFDITGNELTPSAKYDFKFKDYAPWVFRHLRAQFRLDPADYLMSLTSKYILSELGSPGKSGSFFYFSRDYKYIIKTIHPAEHKLLRRILRDYYDHVRQNPNTLLSQFYGLHRVKIPYGKKIHFVVMNNLFPPHRDIHQTFDLKGSTIGRDFREEDLAKNPRATLKDLNWLRRDLHLELGPSKKRVFVTQLERDVRLLQRLKIMDYSLLVGIHDLEKGNEENLRDKTLQIFQPGGEQNEDVHSNMLLRTPSKLENARKARELRQIIKREKPVPLEQTSSRMPDEMLEDRKSFYFYSDDGGLRATHEDGRADKEIYYLGVIDCLTHYGFIKKVEHLWKGLSHSKSQISAIPPEEYGDRFVKFITAITKTREEAEREKEEGAEATATVDGANIYRSSTDRVIASAERVAEKSKQKGSSEEEAPDRTLSSVHSPAADHSNGVGGAILPVVEEAGEAASTTGGRSARSHSGSTHRTNGDEISNPTATATVTNTTDSNTNTNTTAATTAASSSAERDFEPSHHPHGPKPPPTPPKDIPINEKQLPRLPSGSSRLSDSPQQMSSPDAFDLDLRIKKSMQQAR